LEGFEEGGLAWEYLAPGSNWIGKSGESIRYGEVAVEMDEYRRSIGRDRIEPERPYFLGRRMRSR
jgi:hypothetical protein